jgi:small subunit ribosomal protein S14
MTRKSLLVKTKKEAKYRVRTRNRCPLCGRPRSFMRKFGMCRLCFRGRASFGEIPGVRKSSW